MRVPDCPKANSAVAPGGTTTSKSTWPVASSSFQELYDVKQNATRSLGCKWPFRYIRYEPWSAFDTMID